MPSGARQVARLQPRFDRLQNTPIQVNDDASGVDIEHVLVLETVGLVDDFIKATREIQGLEWLIEEDVDDLVPDEDFFDEEDTTAELEGRLYLFVSDQRGIRELLTLWNLFVANPDAPQFRRGLTKWRDVFRNLRDIHLWGPEDRLHETGLYEDWQQRVDDGEEIVSVEIELACRDSVEKRLESESELVQIITDLGGEVKSRCRIPEIRYHSVLCHIPIQSVGEIFENSDAALIKCERVLFIRPSAQASVAVPDDDVHVEIAWAPAEHTGTDDRDTPFVALFDGLPLQNHTLLEGALLVDDPDDWESDYAANERRHGTAMASIIVQGDLDGTPSSLGRKIYVRPILKPMPGSLPPRVESFPDDHLIVDILHRAVRRLFEGDGGEGPVAPSIKVINLSIGDSTRQYYRFPSPLARLLDYLSSRYNVLFIVSAGNHSGLVTLPFSSDEFTLLKADGSALSAEILKVVNNESRIRRLLTPAESLNALSIGASHHDSSDPLTALGHRINPYNLPIYPSPISAQGGGFRKSVKPEIFLPGGKQTYTEVIGTNPNVTLRVHGSTIAPGFRVASPGGAAGNVAATQYMCGTSISTALATRSAAIMCEALHGMRDGPRGDLLHDDYLPVIVKALMVHSAAWGSARELVERAIGRKDKGTVARLLGYGHGEPARLLTSSTQRATVLGFGTLGDDQAELHTFPLPDCLSGQLVWRKLTVTLAWLSPVQCANSLYRRASLWFSPHGTNREDGNVLDSLQVYRNDVHNKATLRGTVQHEIFAGAKAAAYESGSNLMIQVNCRTVTGPPVSNIRYGLVISLEVAPGVNLPIQAEVAARVLPRIDVAVV